MYADHEDDHEGEEWKATPKKKYKKKKLRTNPDGPYNVKFVFKNVNWDITIENESEDDFKVIARSDIKVSSDEIEVLKNYLQAEGFEDAATKHNLFWH